MKKEQEKGSSTHHHDESCALFQQCIQLVVEIVGEVQQTMIRQLDEAFDQMVLGARQVNACDCVFDDDGQLVARVMKREVDEEKKLQGHLEESTSQHSNKWIPLGKTSAQVEKVEKVEGFSKTEPFRSIVPPSPSTSSTSTSASTSLSLPSAAAAAAAAIADNSAVVQRALALKQRLIKVLASMNRPQPPPPPQQQEPQLYRSIPVLQPCKRRRLESSSFVTIQADDDQQIDRPKLPPPPPPPVATLPSTQPSSHHPHKQSIPPVQSFQPSQTSKKDVTFASNHNNNNKKKIISPCKPIPQKPPHPLPPPKPSSTPSFTGGVRCPVSGCPSPPLGDIFKYYSHLYSMHLRRDLHCPVAGCPTSFGTFSLSLLAHHDDRRHASEKKELLQAERRCPRCPLTFSSFTSAAFHAFDVHARGRWVCQRVVVVTEKKGESQLQGVVCNYVATTRREWLLHEEQCNKAATTSTTSSSTMTSTTPATTTTTASSTPRTTTKSTTTISSSISIDTVETATKTAESTK